MALSIQKITFDTNVTDLGTLRDNKLASLLLAESYKSLRKEIENPLGRIYLTDKNILDHFLDRCDLSMKIRDEYTMFYAGLFSVKKKNIMNNSLSDYKNIMIELLKSEIDGGTEGYLLERLWYTLMS
jgi:hypothetical protein